MQASAGFTVSMVGMTRHCPVLLFVRSWGIYYTTFVLMRELTGKIRSFAFLGWACHYPPPHCSENLLRLTQIGSGVGSSPLLFLVRQRFIDGPQYRFRPVHSVTGLAGDLLQQTHFCQLLDVTLSRRVVHFQGDCHLPHSEHRM